MQTSVSPLRGKRVLVVEDEYMIADDLASELRHAGAEVIGPAASLPQAMRLIAQTDRLDGAVLDINLRETLAYPLIDQLIDTGVRVLISSGYDEAMIPERYRHLPRCEKPVSPHKLLLAVAGLWDGAGERDGLTVEHSPAARTTGRTV